VVVSCLLPIAYFWVFVVVFVQFGKKKRVRVMEIAITPELLLRDELVHELVVRGTVVSAEDPLEGLINNLRYYLSGISAISFVPISCVTENIPDSGVVPSLYLRRVPFRALVR
jgi:hypothetical protein